MRNNLLLFVDAIVNLLLGILLMPASVPLADFLGVPTVEPGFYPSILGAVLFGIGIALLIEVFKKNRIMTGLGLYGAVAINIVGGIVLAFWLLFKNLNLPLRGQIFLWILVAVLFILSGVEFFLERRKQKG
jgi:hypothetical protein